MTCCITALMPISLSRRTYIIGVKMVKRWRERYTAAYKNFPFAPPNFDGAPFRARLPEPPYPNAPGWKCSVYYYWWEYLRRHAGYRDTCHNAGKGEYAELYKSFGDVHAGDFETWWWQHLWLFTFVSEALDIDPTRKYYVESDGVFLHVGYARSKTQMLSAVRDTLDNLERRKMLKSVRHLYRYYPFGRPRLPSLHQHLLVWDAKQANPTAADADLADLAGLNVIDKETLDELAALKREGLYTSDLERQIRRSKQLAVQRHLRIAQQYIDNAARGEFPKRDAR
jgi:hypothetical protein